MHDGTEHMKICYIGGGSRDWAWKLMKDLCYERDLAGTIVLYDTDHEAACRNEVIGNALMDAHNPGQWHFVAERSLDRALEGSAFVFISILPGTFSEMAVDVHAPEAYGLYQSVGDTVGPGGLMRALRIIPPYRKIAESIRRLAPDAWVVNYSNPMSICTRTLYRVFPGIKAFGCCHEVFGTQKLLARMLVDRKLADPQAVRREDIKTNVMGINHFTWFDRASWQGMDLFPLYREFAEAHVRDGYGIPSKMDEWHRYFTSGECVKFDLFLRYGLIAAAGDRHLAEFCPPQWYLGSPENAGKWHFALTPVSYRIAQRKELEEAGIAYRDGTRKMEVSRSGEEGIRQIRALMGMGDLVTNVNLPNVGQVPGLPHGAIVETNAVFGFDAVAPVMTGGLPNPIECLTLVHVENQEGIVEASLQGDLEQAYRVFQNDVQVRTLSRDDARDLFRTMVGKTLDGSSSYHPLAG